MAAKLFELAVALARDREDQRVPLIPGLGRSLRAVGELRRAEDLLNEVADSTGEEPPSRFAFFEVASLRDYIAASPGSFRELKEASELEPDSAAEVRARAKIVQAEVSWTEGRYAAMQAPLEDARAAADELGGVDGRALRNSARGWEARAILLGPTPADEGRSLCEEILKDARDTDSRALEAAVLAVQAGLEAMVEQFEEARELYQESRRIGDAFGLASWVAALPLYSGPIELLAGQPAEAGRQLHRGYEALERMGDRSRRATTAAFLAQALSEQQLDDEAKRFAWKAKGLASTADLFTQIAWRGPLAKVLAREGDCESAASHVKEAVSLGEEAETDGLNLLGDAFLDLAVVLRACERPDAEAAAERARELYGQKGNRPGMRRAEQFLEGSSS